MQIYLALNALREQEELLKNEEYKKQIDDKKQKPLSELLTPSQITNLILHYIKDLKSEFFQLQVSAET